MLGCLFIVFIFRAWLPLLAVQLKSECSARGQGHTSHEPVCRDCPCTRALLHVLVERAKQEGGEWGRHGAVGVSIMAAHSCRRGEGGQSLTRVCQAQDDFQAVAKVWDDGSQAVQIEGVS